jgi:SAM-dependent methyltransferase
MHLADLACTVPPASPQHCLVKHIFAGSGPGTQSPDGCSVELYRRLPYLGELEDILASLRTHRTVLELGCGTGRLCSRLLEVGLEVAGVDESADMLLWMPAGVEAIQGNIETLNLGRRWSAVMLASHLINHPDDRIRRAFVECARRHVESGGTFYLKRHDVAWLSSVAPGPLGERAGVAMFAATVSRHDGLVTMTVRYEGFNGTWTQSFSAAPLIEAQVEDLLRHAGFHHVRWYGAGHPWAAAEA